MTNQTDNHIPPPDGDRPNARPTVPVARPLHADLTPGGPAPGYTPLAGLADDLKLRELDRRAALLDFLLVLVAAVVFPYLPQFLIAMEAADIEIELGGVLIVQKWCEAGLGVALLVYLALRHGLPWRRFGLRSDGAARQLLYGLGGTLLAYGGLLVGTVVLLAMAVLTPGVADSLEQRLDFLEELPTLSLGQQVLLLVAVAVHEEIIFRGLLIPYLARLTGRWWPAIVCSSLVFALLHVPAQGWLGAMQIVFVSLALGGLFVVTRSLPAAMIAHFLFDLLQFQLMNLLK